MKADEKERERKRTILNYGHTIAHGLEAATRYKRLLHGEAVAIGMMGAARLSQRLGLLASAGVERQQALLQKFALPASLKTERNNLKMSVAGITEAMELDKKVRARQFAGCYCRISAKR